MADKKRFIEMIETAEVEAIKASEARKAEAISKAKTDKAKAAAEKKAEAEVKAIKTALAKIPAALDILFKNRSYVPEKGATARDGVMTEYGATVQACFFKLAEAEKTEAAAEAVNLVWQMGSANYHEQHKMVREETRKAAMLIAKEKILADRAKAAEKAAASVTKRGKTKAAETATSAEKTATSEAAKQTAEVKTEAKPKRGKTKAEREAEAVKAAAASAKAARRAEREAAQAAALAEAKAAADTAKA